MDYLDPYIYNSGLVKMEVKIKVTVNSIDAKNEVDEGIAIKNNIETTEVIHEEAVKAEENKTKRVAFFQELWSPEMYFMTNAAIFPTLTRAPHYFPIM